MVAGKRAERPKTQKPKKDKKAKPAQAPANANTSDGKERPNLTLEAKHGLIRAVHKKLNQLEKRKAELTKEVDAEIARIKKQDVIGALGMRIKHFNHYRWQLSLVPEEFHAFASHQRMTYEAMGQGDTMDMFKVMDSFDAKQRKAAEGDGTQPGGAPVPDSDATH